MLPAELRREDDLQPGERFDVERLEEGAYVLRRVRDRPNRGLVELLRSCPERDWFERVDRMTSTDDVAGVDLG